MAEESSAFKLNTQVHHRFNIYVMLNVQTSAPAEVFGSRPSGRFSPGSSLYTPIGGGHAFWFRFGAVAFHNVEESAQLELLQRFCESETVSDVNNKIAAQTIVTEKLDLTERVGASPRVEFDNITLDYLNLERVELIAFLVSQSAALDYYEKALERTFGEVTTLVQKLRDTGTFSPFPKRLHRFIGRALDMKNNIVGSLHYLDHPDLLWDDATMDALYSDLQAYFDLKERFSAVERKLDSIQDSLELLLDTARDRRMYWLEAAIVGLIAFEIVWAFIK